MSLGSVFKIVSSAIALEENQASVDKANVYSCKGYQMVSGIKIGCAYTAGHGSQNLRTALTMLDLLNLLQCPLVKDLRLHLFR